MNEHINITTVPLVYKGEVITDKGEALSLTDMWRAQGSPENREPFNWARKEGAPFIEAVAMSHNLPDSQVMTTKRGKGGATFGHWQIALAYAKYLSPEFHMWCNQVVRERMEAVQQHAVATLRPDVLEMIRRDDGISRMLAHKITEMEKVIAMIAATIQPQRPVLYREGKTAGQIWRAAGFPAMKGVAVWFGNRLEVFNCRVADNGCAEMGLTKARLFDPDKAQFWLENGGRAAVKAKIMERKGQGRLSLINPTHEPEVLTALRNHLNGAH